MWPGSLLMRQAQSPSHSPKHSVLHETAGLYFPRRLFQLFSCMRLTRRRSSAFPHVPLGGLSVQDAHDLQVNPPAASSPFIVPQRHCGSRLLQSLSLHLQFRSSSHTAFNSWRLSLAEVLPNVT